MRILREIINFFEREWKPGSTAGDYVIQSSLGKGSYGTAYLVKHKVDSQLAVLKRLRPYKRFIDPSGKLLASEARILESLESSHFPKLYSRGMKGKVPYIVMEYFHGKTFDALIFEEGKTFDEKESLTIVKKITELVGCLHSRGIIHRDLRIPNVILQDGSLKIIDFGLAVETGHEFVSHKKHKDFMREKSQKADFYAMGHFLLFLLYSSYDIEGQLERSWEEELNLSPPAVSILRKLLQIDEPYPDFQTLLEALETAAGQNS